MITKNQETITIIKIALLGIIGGILSFLIFFFFNNFLVSFNFGLLWFVIAFLVLFLAVYALEMILVRDFSLLMGITFLQGLIPLAVLYPYLSFSGSGYFIILPILFLITSFTLGARKGFNNLENSVRLKFTSSIHGPVSKILVSILIVFTLFSYFHLFHLDNFNTDRSRLAFDGTLGVVEPAFQVWFPDTSFDMTTSEAVTTMTRVQLDRNKLDLLRQGTAFENMPPEFQAEVRNNIRNNIISTIEGIFGRPVNLDQRFGAYMFQSSQQMIQSLSLTTKSILEVGLVLLLFSMIKGLSFIIYMLAEVIAFIIFKLLMLTGFVYIDLKSVSKDEIVIQ